MNPQCVPFRLSISLRLSPSLASSTLFQPFRLSIRSMNRFQSNPSASTYSSFDYLLLCILLFFFASLLSRFGCTNETAQLNLLCPYIRCVCALSFIRRFRVRLHLFRRRWICVFAFIIHNKIVNKHDAKCGAAKQMRWKRKAFPSNWIFTGHSQHPHSHTTNAPLEKNDAALSKAQKTRKTNLYTRLDSYIFTHTIQK